MVQHFQQIEGAASMEVRQIDFKDIEPRIIRFVVEGCEIAMICDQTTTPEQSMTEPRGMIADTWHLNTQQGFAGQPESAQPTSPISPYPLGPTQQLQSRPSSGFIADPIEVPVAATVAKVTSGPVHEWGKVDDAALAKFRTATPRLELHERDARLVALHMALDSRVCDEHGDHIVKRAEAFLAFLTGGGSAG